MYKIYPALFHKEGSGYWVEFPDLEGCVSDGDSLESVMKNSQEALGLYLNALTEDGTAFPQPSSIEDVDAEDPESEFKSYVGVETDRYRRNTKAVKKTVSIPEWLAEEAEKNHLSLSKVLQDGIKTAIGQ